jgi:hypothetical protein
VIKKVEEFRASNPGNDVVPRETFVGWFHEGLTIQQQEHQKNPAETPGLTEFMIEHLKARLNPSEKWLSQNYMEFGVSM